MAAAPTRPPPPPAQKQDTVTADITAPKRKRTDTTPTSTTTTTTTAAAEGPTTKKTRLEENSKPGLGARLGLATTTQGDSANAAAAAFDDRIEEKYDVQVLSVLSASKIQKRVVHVLQHIGRGVAAKTSSSTTSTTITTAAEQTVASGKPRISILRARAADAGKLITIAEIAKRELEKEEERGGGEGEGEGRGVGSEVPEGVGCG